MSYIPIYLKSDPEMPRPKDPEFYWVTRDGTFLCRNHDFFASDTPTGQKPRALANHQARCQVRYPKLGVAGLEYIVGFFDRVFELHRSEAIVLLFWDLRRERYKLWVPQQEATVWESSGGHRSPTDVKYEVPVPMPRGHLLIGDIHCHGDLEAYSSYTDKHDEVYRDGIHAVVGHIDRDTPQFHLEMAIDGFRFKMEFDQFFRGYRGRRRRVPKSWLEQVKVIVNRPLWVSQTSTSDSQDNWYGA